MLKVCLVCVGTLKERFFAQAVAEYAKRLGRFCQLSIEEIPEKGEKFETEEILKRKKGFCIAMAIEGEGLSSEGLAKKLASISQTNSCITFVIGGSNGLGDAVKKQSDYLLSFSQMTFPHHLMRVVALEQIYRAFCINEGNSYHK